MCHSKKKIEREKSHTTYYMPKRIGYLGLIFFF